MSKGSRAPAKPAAGHRPKLGVSRRRLLADGARTACGVALFGLAVGLHARRSAALPVDAIRPPGARAEADFLGICARCGLCVRDCPYNILELAELGENVAAGTPYFIARQGACEMCTDIPCVPACPTGALDHELTDITKARMGLAVLIDQEACIAFQGLRCEVCFNACPLRGKAITIDYRPNIRTGKHAIFPPVVVSEYCTGCGLCERVCILEEAAIKVLPIRLAKGTLGRHYSHGWEEKQKAGGALVTPDPEHKYNLPQGMDYEHAGRGLVASEPAPAMPFAANPLDTLNQGTGGGR
ncbi:Ferredoxin-type protein NapG (periplasmic nitrate reductase) [hydrothermal vent metagenome]|uniref:Ferredoxin-type protein NapG (Periplasmic nitrate reductase) n=1 Tax=hydrothermal vent metagenome TaxID=652676 RepID=A0A3B0TNJ7_9ZZZZ